jgi:triacylglycerol lipase
MVSPSGQHQSGGSVPSEFRLDAAPSSFDVDRAIAAYIPLLEACYAKANQRPFAFPAGYAEIAEIRAELAQVAAMAAAEPPAVQEALENDVAAAAAATVDPASFGFVIREDATGSILVCLRGTQTPREWLANFTAVPSPFNLVPGFGRVHLGFERMEMSVRNSIVSALNAVPTDTRITVLGHSLGGAMAVLAAVDLKRNVGRSHVDVCTMGGPRVGKADFRRNFDREIADCFRVTNVFDIVPHVPSLITGWNHVGEEIEVDGQVESPHSLAAYLSGLRNIGQGRELRLSEGVPEAVGIGVVSLRRP